MYPEISSFFPSASEKIEDEIADLLINAGVAYHRPNQIAPAMKREEASNGILFQRGIALDSISRISGMGFYAKQESEFNPGKIKSMFGLESNTLQALWNTALSAASWKSILSFESSTEYLRLKPPFFHGYWENTPDTSGSVSMLRTGLKGAQLYYLYRYSADSIEVSQLPQWQIEDCNYRSLSCACLFSNGTLPPIGYCHDGAVVHLHLHYLLPPRELNFLKLYSWPEDCSTFPCDYKRVVSADIFPAIKAVLSDGGYQFEGVLYK